MYSSQTIIIEKHFELIIEQLILLNNKIELLENKINNINNFIKPPININHNFDIKNIDWESVLYY
jgi:hypothetical protein